MTRPTPKVDFLQGTLELLILRTLATGQAHGHDIAKSIRLRSEDVLTVETGSLYPALYRLEARGWVEASWAQSDKGKRARYYRLTRSGRKHLHGEESRWEAFSRAMRLVLRARAQEDQ